MLSSVFCSMTSCGWISTLKRREVWNRRSSTLPKEISRSGRSKIGSQTERIAASNSSTRVVSGRHPAGFDVRLSDTLVVAAEEGEEVLRQVVLVDVGERADDAEIERDVAALRGDQDVARMHVGMEEAVAEDLGEEDLDAHPRESFFRSTPSARSASICDRQAVHALHDHDRRSCSGPSTPRARAAGRVGKLRRSCSRSPPRASGRVRRAGAWRIRRPPRAA
jgi:hypothetical protein